LFSFKTKPLGGENSLPDLKTLSSNGDAKENCDEEVLRLGKNPQSYVGRNSEDM
jgi:hypothetical protein